VSDTKTDQFAPTDYRAQLHGSQARERGLVVERDALRADLAKAQQALKVCEDLGISITVRPGSDGKDHAFSNARAIAAEESLAKAQARCAELEAALAVFYRHIAPWEMLMKAATASGVALPPNLYQHLASDGTKALAAVRLAQRALREHPDLGDHKVALKALAEAFGSGE
jgi:hypothetical protein